MKSKIALITMLIIVTNSVFAYADDSFDVMNKSYSIQTASGTVAIGGAVASAVLALATKVGVEFATGSEMDKFVRDMISDVNGIDVLNSIADAITVAGAGIIGLPASIVSTFCNYINQKNLGDTSITYLKFTDDEGVKHSIPIMPYNFSSSSLYGNKGWALFRKACDLADNSTSVVFRNNGISTNAIFRFPNIALGFKNRGRDILFASGSSTASFENSGLSGYTRDWSSGYSRAKCFILGVPTSSNLSTCDFEIELGYVFYNPMTGVQYGSAGVVSLPYGRYWKRDVSSGASVPNAPSVPDNLVNSPGKSSIAIPTNPNDLIGKTPSDITTTPDYDVWSPGTVVVPPISDNPSVSYTPDLSVPGTPDIDKPSDSISWDWLKNLIQSIIDLIKSILDWLNNFWTHLWEFFKSLLVPSDTYFVDEFGKVTEKMKEKIPGIDITKLEDLAVGEFKFKDIYAKFFGLECLVVRGSVINRVIGWARPIIQGLIALFLLLYNYNQIYFLIRGSSLLGASNTIDNMNNNRIGGRK